MPLPWGLSCTVDEASCVSKYMYILYASITYIILLKYTNSNILKHKMHDVKEKNDIVQQRIALLVSSFLPFCLGGSYSAVMASPMDGAASI